MLPPAILDAADRLITILMTLVDAIYPIALDGSTPTLSDRAAKILFARLSRLVTSLIHICHVGTRARPNPDTPRARTQPAPATERSNPAQRLPSRPGWLLAALPDIAPSVAADLAALLADPALTTLLADAPTLRRTLRPLLRSLDLADTEPPPSPHPVDPPPVPEPPPIAEPGPPHIPTATPCSPTLPSQKSTSSNPPFSTSILLRFSNGMPAAHLDMGSVPTSSRTTPHTASPAPSAD